MAAPGRRAAINHDTIPPTAALPKPLWGKASVACFLVVNDPMGVGAVHRCAARLPSEAILAGRNHFGRAISRAGKLIVFEGNSELIAGVRAQAAYGRTPKHAIYVIEGRGEKLPL